MQLVRLTIVALVVLCGFWFLLLASSPLRVQGQEQRKESSSSVCLTTANTVKNEYKNTLLPGELPGYTGWARPDRTLAGSFFILEDSSTVVVGEPYKITVQCKHAACRAGGALFYVRAYGPAIVPSYKVQDHANGTYDIFLRHWDAGRYTVEVVLVFSHYAPFSDFPVKDDRMEAAYEGYLLPGFPRTIHVVTSSAASSSASSASSSSKLVLPTCQLPDLVETSKTGATETGRWLVTKKIMDQDYSRDLEHEQISLAKYQKGDNSLGVRLDYFPVKCRLLREDVVYAPQTLQTCLEHRKASSAKSNSKSNSQSPPSLLRQPHVVFIGDSNFRLQKEVFSKFFGGTLPVTYMKTQDGIVARLPQVKAALNELVAQDKATSEDKDYFVLFNTGLHDIIRLCTHDYPYSPASANAADKTQNVLAEHCGAVYRRALVDFVQTVQAFPAVLAVWQTTTAGWPKWGMYAASWPGDTKQKLPLAPNFCEYFNEIAWDVMQEYNVTVQDAYWLTLSRPDHRDAREKNALGKRLVHAGPQVYSVTMRKWAMMILETLCPNVLYNMDD
jgi:hypothetical protein